MKASTTRALILGVNGQDGSYLAQHLIEQGCEVVGVGRTPALTHWLAGLPIAYYQQDLRDTAAVQTLVESIQPDEIYHFAAVHGSAGFAYEPVFPDVQAVNTTSLHPILEYATKNPGVRILYGSSAKVFGSPLQGHICEDSPKAVTCLYSLTKLAAEALIAHYRSKFGIQAGIVYLFQHESIRRGDAFFFSMLTRGLAACLANPSKQLTVRTLDFYCDWGCAREFMELAIELLRTAPGTDVILATGHTVYAKNLTAELCTALGLSMPDCVVETTRSDVTPLFFSADISRLKAAVGRGPVIMAHDLALSLIKENLA